MPKDFQFQIIGEVDSYDSSSGIFKRISVTENFKDTSIVEKLTKEEMEKIYHLIETNNFFSLPANFECSENKNDTISYILPSFTTTIIVKALGVSKKVEYSSYCSPKLDLNAEKQFQKIENELKTIIYTKSKIQKLPKTKMIFL